MAQVVPYDDEAELRQVSARLRTLPPLVTSWEIERLRDLLAEAEDGRRLVLQGGDCAESLDECTPDRIANKLKILLQMSLVLVQGAKRPVVRIGRFAGQYAKPRTSPTETRRIGDADVTLPSYFGDLVNQPEFNAPARRPDPGLMIRGYAHAAMTLNFIRALVDGGFADLHHPEYWDLSFFGKAGLAPSMRAEYERITRSLADGLRLMEALSEQPAADATRVEFFTSHEALNLHYEAAATRTVPRREGWYNLSAHLPWIGERTRKADGAHIEYCRGIRNPIGVKLGPSTRVDEAVELSRILNPANEKGRLVFISRLGAAKVRQVLPTLVAGVAAAGRRCAWICDPMHGNGSVTGGGIKTRSFDAILDELEGAIEVHQKAGVPLAGVHFELTGEDVTECLGGAAGVREEDLSLNYATRCDPRLNYQQSLEMAFLLARRLETDAGRGTQPPPGPRAG